jgi:hypothetical protein
MAFYASACDEKDTTGPEITLTEPEEGEEYAAGSAGGVHIEFDLADVSGLNEYKVDIHSGEGHSHSSLIKAASWNYQKAYEDAKGLKNHHAHDNSDTIPADATLGKYHLVFSATDVHGNESVAYRTFKIVAHTEDDHDDHDDE